MPKRRFHPAHIWAIALLTVMVVSGCTGEEPVEIDLDATIPPTSAPVDPEDPNEAQRQELQDLA